VLPHSCCRTRARRRTRCVGATLGSYKDDGKMIIYGKVESGSIVVGD
jgi:hypothetical protein